MPHGWQLLDRPREFDAVRSALTGAGSYGVVLVGDAGVGKTTLARSVTESLRSQVHWVASTESSRSIPLGVFAHLVGGSSSRDATALLASARESLVSQGNSIVGVDDAHLLDELSATLLHQMAVDQTGRILATVRSGEPVPDAVTSLWKDGYLRRIELQPFTKQQSVQLVESVIGGRLEGLSADLMWESSGGNPLFLRHLVEGSIDAGTLKRVDDVWQLRGPTAVPSGLVALLESRLEHAGDTVLTALKLLALCEPLDIDALTELAGDAAVDDAEMRGLIRFQQDGPVLNARFSHPLVGDVVRSKVGRAAERRLKGQVVQILRRRGLDTAASRIRMAQLSIDSDQPVDTELLTSAAKDAIYLSNLPLGERLARRAFERTGSLADGALLSRALLWQGKPAAADAILAQFAPADLDEVQLVQWGVPRASTLFWSMSEVAAAHEVLALANERVRHPALRLILDATEAAMAVHENRIEEGIAEALRVLADPQAPDQAVEFAAFAAGLAMPVAGRGDEFEPIAARCRAEQKTTDGMIRVMVRYCDVLALTHTGQFELADKRAAAYADFSSVGQFLAWAIAKIMAGAVANARGDFPEVVSSIEQALAALSAESPLPWQLPGRLLLARAYAALGRIGEAERVLTDAAEHSGPSMALHEPQRLIARSWYAAAKGMERNAVELARAAADNAHRSGQYALEAEALHHATRFGDRTTAPRLAELAGMVHGNLAALYARHAAAVAAADAAALDAVSTEFERAGLLLSAADAAAQAAPLYDAAGDRRRTSESGATALRLAEACGGATTPAIRTAARPLPLTPREREIAELVSAGLSNREVAEQLTLSVRTVEGHVYRACFKLDVADRDELARVVGKKR
ncbi:helix-turn-helix transcriptional regulator [Mycolicibacterium chubuense]|uniref:Tetrathionate response regulatory protein TtrR n=1 Tax=Mycolicibacterium chubuense TaxID=1800 RepID=A0A0J6ZAZ1_MYCCU|nr:LuxR family transcriptional regulator [Mycolicibacterium chubuense]KMO81846.1 Tetrathionate response regulatory protein TtrR [Mycolicibacterium chubuense]ORA44197.1 helix-turn-helix transcriptional regulator [Mycolicibacterium chubuense]SPY46361.1 response regulator containing a CheY-like receiver domain and an HTH DNA-binding domain [Mycolicibacterium chubuense]